MYCKEIKIKDYRNISDAKIELCEGINIMYGPNGSGKTNMAEAIYCFAIAKSFRVNNIKALIKNGCEYSEAEAVFVRKNRFYGGKTSDRAKVTLRRKNPAKYEINGIEYTNSDFMGNFKAVLYTPETIELVKGAPADRRKFLDIALCQLDRSYLDCLKKYNSALKERNECVYNYNLLKSGKGFSDNEEARERLYGLIGVYSEILCRTGAYIMCMRAHYTERLKEKFSSFFKYVYGKENFSITLEYSPALSNTEQIKIFPFSSYRRELRKSMLESYDYDIEKGVFPYGPSKDELIIRRDGRIAKDCTSQGQQKIIAVALKVAEGLIYAENSGELPLFILDDIMSELDRTTQIRITELFSNYQTVITSADAGYVGSVVSLFSGGEKKIKLIEVNEGRFDMIGENF